MLDIYCSLLLLKVRSMLKTLINSLFVSGDLYRLLMSFANSLDPDQDRQNVGPDLDPNRLTLC